MKLHSSLPARFEACDWPKELQCDPVEQLELMFLCRVRGSETWVNSR